MKITIAVDFSVEVPDNTTEGDLATLTMGIDPAEVDVYMEDKETLKGAVRNYTTTNVDVDKEDN